MNTKSKKQAFTIIELLVVISVIAIIATLAIVFLRQARVNARDSKRLSDIRQIQVALELFYNEVGRYPNEEELSTNNSIEHNGSVFMNKIPSSPTPADGPCDFLANTYKYQILSSQNFSYVISFCLGSFVLAQIKIIILPEKNMLYRAGL